MAPTRSDADRPIELAITGMTCASCVARVERRLGRLPGATATVNLATGTAHVTRESPDVGVDELIAAVESIGYLAEAPRTEPPAAEEEAAGEAADASWRAGSSRHAPNGGPGTRSGRSCGSPPAGSTPSYWTRRARSPRGR